MNQEVYEGWKKIGLTAGSALVVYLLFRYALPLVLPFILAFLMAVLIRPPVRLLRKYLHVKEGIGAVIVLLLVGGLLLLILNYAGALLVKEMQELLEDLKKQDIVNRLLGNETGKVMLLGKDCTAAA